MLIVHLKCIRTLNPFHYTLLCTISITWTEQNQQILNREPLQIENSFKNKKERGKGWVVFEAQKADGLTWYKDVLFFQIILNMKLSNQFTFQTGANFSSFRITSSLFRWIIVYKVDKHKIKLCILETNKCKFLVESN